MCVKSYVRENVVCGEVNSVVVRREKIRPCTAIPGAEGCVSKSR
jgi:hypothetical protein